MVIGQYISQILELFNIYSDDSTVEVEWIKDLINNQRQLLLKQHYGANRFVVDDIISDLGCLVMELVDEAECCEINAGCTILRSVKEIPRLMPFKNFNGLYKVSGIKKFTSIPYTIVPMTRAPYIGQTPWTKKEIYVFLKDQHIYVISANTNIRLIKYINAWGVVGDPTELANFIDCDNAPCYTDNSQYPMPTYLWPLMKESIIREVAYKLGQPYDTSNDNREDVNTSASRPEGATEPNKSKIPQQ